MTTEAQPNTDEITPADPSPAAAPNPLRRTILFLLLAGAVCAGMGQTIVFSVLPPLAREIGLADAQVLFIFMFSAALWVFLGPRWGRRSDHMGRKPFILVGLIGFACSMVFFGMTISFGLTGALSGMILFVILVVTRSFYGVFGSAGPPAAQAYIADRTSKDDRTAGIASYSAAFGLGAMLGPGLGAAATLISPTAPFLAIGAIAAVMSVIVFIYLPEKTSPRERDKKAKVKFTDPRIRPFIIFGFSFGFINAIPIQTIGFYFMDALGYSAAKAPQFVSIGLTGGAMAALFAQLFVVRKLKAEPRNLLRAAPVVVIIGHSLIWLAPQLWPVVSGMVLAGFAAGLAVPGFNAAASLAVEPDEQGGAIGLAGAAGAAGFIFAPMLAAVLLQLAPKAPYIFTTLLGVTLMVFAYTSRAVAEASPSRITKETEGDPASSPYQ